MTREEAIKELKYSIEMVHFDPYAGETSEWLNEEDQRYVDACNMAIKALQLIPDIETVLHNSSYVTNDEYEDEVIEVELIQRILNKVKEEVIE